LLCQFAAFLSVVFVFRDLPDGTQPGMAHTIKTITRKGHAQPSFPDNGILTSMTAGLIATVLFCVVGLVVTAVAVFCFPNLGAITAQYNQF
jgi:hypothetical protein